MWAAFLLYGLYKKKAAGFLSDGLWALLDSNQ